MEQNKKIITWSVIGIVILALFGWQSGLFEGGSSVNGDKANQEQKKVLGEDAFRPDNADALGTVEGGTREKVKKDIATPDVNSTSSPKDVAVPTNVVKTGNISFRNFTIEGNGGKFNPSIIVVNEGDVIDMSLKAIDADYSVFFSDFGVYGVAKKGETKKIQFQAPEYGQYKFVCNDVCSSEISGTLIVNKKQ